MDVLWQFGSWLRAYLGPVLVLALSVVAMVAVRAVLGAKGSRFVLSRQLATLGLAAVGLLALLLALPISPELRGQLLGFVGVILSAALALSSTTFIGNMLAGIMLRIMRNFRPGDYLSVEDHFGRVSDRSLLHTEIQTEDRDLTTLPNLYLVTHPMTVVRSSGAIVSATISLGYDVPRSKVELLLLAAAAEAKLAEPFVHLVELGDFSVTYRVAGLLEEVKQLLSARSALRAMMLDALHEGGVEIVSPTFMTTRALSPGARIIPEGASPRVERERAEAIAEEVMFDKAEEAGSLEKMRIALEELGRRIEVERSAQSPEGDREERKERLEKLHAAKDRLRERIALRERQDRER